MKKMKRIASLMLVFVLGLQIAWFANPMTVEAANKAARIKFSTEKTLKGDIAWHYENGVAIRTVSAGKIKLKKNSTISADLYVPKEALAKKGSMVVVDLSPDMDINGNNYILLAKYRFTLKNTGKKIKITKSKHSIESKEFSWSTRSDGNASSKMITCKKSGKYYKISIKNNPMLNYMGTADKNGCYTNKVKIITNKSGTPSLQVDVFFNQKIKNKYFYVDNIKMSGATSKTVTFDKNDYDSNYLIGWYNSTHYDAVKVTTVK